MDIITNEELNHLCSLVTKKTLHLVLGEDDQERALENPIKKSLEKIKENWPSTEQSWKRLRHLTEGIRIQNGIIEGKWEGILEFLEERFPELKS